MRILVTGGAGFIGSHLVRRLIEGGRHSVVNLDALKYSGNLENLKDLSGGLQYTFVHADICDQNVVHSVLQDHRIEGIINCAAETHVDRSILDPGAFARTDVVGTGVLLEEARQAGVRRFLQVSTDEVYGSVAQGSSREEDRLEPRSPYSASKAGGDLLALSYWTTYHFPVVVTRGSNTYGPNQY
nr:SDR family NAD(P)-dependent oxidoreductase [Nitrospira sp.]